MYAETQNLIEFVNFLQDGTRRSQNRWSSEHRTSESYRYLIRQDKIFLSLLALKWLRMNSWRTWNYGVEIQNPVEILKPHLINGERLENRNLKVFRLLNPIVTPRRKEFQRTSKVENLCWQKRQKLGESRTWTSDFRRSPLPNKMTIYFKCWQIKFWPKRHK